MTRSPMLALALMLTTSALAAAPPTATAPAGTTVVGERDAAMGLYLSPWKDESADGLEQAPALLEVPPQAVDESSLRRQTEYRDTVSRYRREHESR